MHRRHRTQSLSKRGFTLIEVLVATLIMTLLVGLVIQVTNEVLKVWNRASGQLSANYEARIAMELLTRDLETAIVRNNGLEWLRAETSELRGISGDFRTQTTKLILFTPALDRGLEKPDGEDVVGDVCAVAYFLDYRNPVSGREADVGSGKDAYVLYRSLIYPDVTFEEILGDPEQSNLDSLTQYFSRNAIVGDGSSGSGGQQGQAALGGNFLAGNIVDFTVTLFTRDAQPTSNQVEMLELPDDVPGLRQAGVIYGGTEATVGPQASTNFPELTNSLEYAEISLTVVSDEGMRILQQLDAGIGGTGYADLAPDEAEDLVIREHGKTFVRRVYFPAQPF